MKRFCYVGTGRARITRCLVPASEHFRLDHADQPEIASAKAHEVAASQSLVVIGHFTSPASLAGGKIYRDAALRAAFVDEFVEEGGQLEGEWSWDPQASAEQNAAVIEQASKQYCQRRVRRSASGG